MVVFGFVLQKTQTDTICVLFYERRDLFLFVRTGFEKNLIFEIILFIWDSIGVVIILMS